MEKNIILSRKWHQIEIVVCPLHICIRQDCSFLKMLHFEALWQDWSILRTSLLKMISKIQYEILPVFSVNTNTSTYIDL